MSHVSAASLLLIDAEACPSAQHGAVESTPSLEEIYAEHFEFVWRNARRLRVPAAAADDIVQDVFIVVHRRLEDFRGGPIRPWIFGILARVVSQYRRTQKRNTGRYVQFDCAHLSDPEQASPSELTETAERTRLFASLFEELSEEQRVLLLLADFEEWKLRELAEYFATNIGTVYSRLTSARQRFGRAYARAMAKRKNSS